MISHQWMYTVPHRLFGKPNELVGEKRPVLGSANNGLVSGTMPQEADRGCAEMSYPRPSGRSTTTKQGIKINRGQHGRATAEQEVSHWGRDTKSGMGWGEDPLDCCSQFGCFFFMTLCCLSVVWWSIDRGTVIENRLTSFCPSKTAKLSF